MSDFSVSVQTADGVVAVALAGEIDLAEADRLWKELSPRLTPASTMLVDCSGVAFLDSAGLSTLLRLADWATAVGAGFRLTGRSEAVRRVLELAGVDRMFAGPDEGSGAASAR